MIEVRGVSFSYREGEADAVRALRDLDLEIEPGRLTAVIGHNGSGKSTLVKLLTAVLYPTEGEVRVDGVPVRHETRWEVRNHVSVVFQDPDDQLVMNRVADDVAFGPENLGLAREEIAERVESALDAMDLTELSERILDDLSLGQKQRVAIAGALAMRPRYLILDEPTSLLPAVAAESLMRTARELNRGEGMGVIHVTHSMSEAALFDRVVVLDEGRLVMDGSPAEVFRRTDELREIGLDVPLAASLAHRLRFSGIPLEGDVLTDADLRTAIAALARGLGVTGPSGEAPLIELRDFRYAYLEGTPRAVEAARGVSFEVRRGERVGIVGPTQSGKSTVVYALAHLLRLKEGQVFHEGEDVAAPGYDRAALRRKVGVVFQRPDFQILEDVVGKDVAFGPTAAGVSVKETRERVEESLEAVGLSYPEFRLRYVYALSGGQKRRVALAGVLAMRAPLLVLDEPMAGLDPRGRRELFGLFERLRQQRDLTTVFCSSSLADVSLLCDRLIVLEEGRVALDGPVREVLAEADRLQSLGIALPEPVALARELQEIFPDLPSDLLTEEELEEALLARLGERRA